MSLQFTGERFIPTEQGELSYEHWHRYAWAMHFVRGKNVLDIACGEGYGTALLAQAAAQAVGMDIDAASVAHASATYVAPNVQFKVGSVTKTNLPPASFDVIISFETLEHIDQHDAMLAELKKLLKPDGLLIVSTPDKAVYTDARPGYVNEYHVKELYRPQFEQLLSAHFAAWQLYGQQMATASFMLPVQMTSVNMPNAQTPQHYQAHTQHGKRVDHQAATAQLPMYLIAVCAQNDQALAAATQTASVYIDAEHGLHNEREQAVQWARNLNDELSAAQLEVRRMQGEFAQAQAWATQLNQTLATNNAAYEQKVQELETAQTWAKQQTIEVEQLGVEIDRLAAEHHKAQTWAQQQGVEAERLGAEVRRISTEHQNAVDWAQGLDVELANAGAAIKHLNVEYERLQQSLNQRIQSLQDELNRSQSHAQYLEMQLRLQRERGDQLQQQVNAFLASKSWRYTKPLRFIGRLVRGDWVGAKRGLVQQSRSFLGGTYHILPSALQHISRASFFGIFPNRLVSSKAHQQWMSERQQKRNATVAAKHSALAIDQSVQTKLAFLKQIKPDEQPQVTVVIPTYGNLAYTVNCLASLFEHRPKTKFSVLVIEDCSGDAQMACLADLACIQFVNNPTNLGFVRSCNRAVSMVNTELVHLLNNDTVVTEGWLDQLVQLMQSRADCGMVGSKLIYPDGRLQEAGGILWNDASAWNFGRLDDPQRSIYNYVKEVDYISGASIMLRLKLWQQLGGFDELYVPAYCEDSDLAFRVRQAGFKVLYQPASVIVHFEGISNGTDTGSGIKAYQVTNQKKFLERWGSTLQQSHFPNAEQVFLARDRSRSRRCVLVIDHYIPQPDRDAGSRTMLLYLKCLVDLGLNVKFWPENLHADRQYLHLLEQLGIEVMYGAEYHNGFEAWMQHNGQHIAAVLLSRPHISVQFLKTLEQYPHISRIYYGHDIHHLRMLDEVKQGLASASDAGSIEQMQQLEQAVWRQSDVVLYPSDDETRYVRNWMSEQRLQLQADTIAPYAFEQLPAQATYAGRADLLFVGGFNHGPNVDGILWFCQDILPLLRKAQLQLKLHVVGSNAPDRVMKLASEHVVVHGFVSDEQLQHLYDTCKVVVAPLRFGGGVKGKVIEAFKFGTPVVTTEAGVQGLNDYKDQILHHNDPAQFAQRVLSLLDDEPYWQSVSQNQLQIVRERFDIVSLKNTLKRWFVESSAEQLRQPAAHNTKH